ncbi:MAG: heparinase II/III domain-containing protein, partial [Blastocatellia bacterium]
RRFLAAWRASIYRQLDFLSRHLEFHLLANHLLKNVKALVIGGLFFGHERWLAAGERLLWREFEEQVLEDGGHYERSPMYHAQATVDFLECYALLGAFNRLPPNASEVESKLRLMAGFLEAMSYADGTLALFNDSANTEETRPRPVIETAKRVCGYGEKSFPREFRQTGYWLWVSADEREKIVVDAGPPSVAYNAAHAHCDLLSYELWLDGEPFIVDSGVHGYGGDRFREYCRSTRAHNTVMFDGREQSEVWGAFRMARRAALLSYEANSEEGLWRFSGAYVPYHAQHRPYYTNPLIHGRQIKREANGDWIIADTMLYGMANRASSFIHLHPRVSARQTSRHSLPVECKRGDLTVLIEPFGVESCEIIAGAKSPLQGWYFPDFGVAQPSQTIRFDCRVKIGEAFGYRIRRR